LVLRGSHDPALASGRSVKNTTLPSFARRLRARVRVNAREVGAEQAHNR
jgi:hypothetical protein